MLESLFLFFNLCGFLNVSIVTAKQPRELTEVLRFWWSPVCHMQLQSENVPFLGSSLGCTLNPSHLNRFEHFLVGPVSVLPVACSGEAVP